MFLGSISGLAFRLEFRFLGSGSQVKVLRFRFNFYGGLGS
jgi:hypothetical protein